MGLSRKIDMEQFLFTDKLVSYDTFLEDVSERVAIKLRSIVEKKREEENPICSQRQAYKKFGSGNVRRWIRERKLVPFSKRPGKIEYRLSDLRILFNQEQDYL